MARTGLYKTEVKKARDALLAKSKHPSVDAVRIELGNTGSKTTIHKYLKELEEEDGGARGRKASISEVLQDLVSRLASRMHEEADARMEELRSQVMEREHKHAETIGILQKENAALSIQLQRTETASHQEAKAHTHTREALQQELIVRHTLEQQVTGLKERLSENEAHRQSLEEKHTHARDALEHYRQSALQNVAQSCKVLEVQVIEKDTQVKELKLQLAEALAQSNVINKSMYDLQLELATLQTKLEAQHAMMAELRAYMGLKEETKDKESRPTKQG